MQWFRKIKTGLKSQQKKQIPDNLWIKCPGCGEILYRKELNKNGLVCAECNYHFYMSAKMRLDMTLDEGSFKESDAGMTSVNPLGFPSYDRKLQKGRDGTELSDSLITGTGTIGSMAVAMGVGDAGFMMGSMASVFGERFSRLARHAVQKGLPLVFVSAGGGGVRMQEGMIGLMQMPKTGGAVAHLHRHNLPFVSVLTNPTMGGVMASYASLGDIILAEPGALIGFTGPRVIKQTIGEELPPGFQSSEFQLEHGMIDMIVSRRDLRSVLARILKFFYTGRSPDHKNTSAETGRPSTAATP